MNKLILRKNSNNDILIGVASTSFKESGVPIIELALKMCNEGEPFWIVDEEDYNKEVAKYPMFIGIELDLDVLGEPTGYGSASNEFSEETLKKLKG